MEYIKEKKIILVNKPLNWTSNDVVQKVKKIINAKKVGHSGTLDPLATGLIILGINEGTKMLNDLITENKTYEAEIIFGFNTTTYDLEGIKISTTHNIPTLQQIVELINQLKLKYYQTPPIYSAIKKNGKKSYELARQNKIIELEPRLVKILDFNILEFKNNILKITIDVSKGFYVRSFAYDLGKHLNSAATLYSLKRTKIGQYDLKDALKIEEIYDYWTKL